MNATGGNPDTALHPGPSYADLQAENASLLAHNVALADALEALLPYCRHIGLCPRTRIWPFRLLPCDCGLDIAARKIGEEST